MKVVHSKVSRWKRELSAYKLSRKSRKEMRGRKDY